MTTTNPDGLPELTASMCPSSDYAKGWNDCLAAMLAAAPSASGGEPPPAASVSERARDDLHVAICQAVALMNMEPMTTSGLLQAHDILRKAIS